MKIRKAKREDFERLLELNQKLFLYEKQFGNTYDEEWPYSEKGRVYFASRIENGIVLVAEINKRIVGYVCSYIDSYSFRLINPVAEIENLFVEEGFRNNKIGSKLISESMKLFKKKKVGLVKVGAMEKNVKTIDFYLKNRFIRHSIFLEKEI